MTLFQSWGSLGSDYPGVGGGTLIFSYIFRFGALFLVQNFRKVILLGVRRFVDIFFFFFWGGGGGVITKSDYFFFFGGGVSFLYIIGRFKVKIQNGNIFLGRKFSNIFGYT